MSNVIDLIKYWRDSGEDFATGVGIFLDYGRNNQLIRSQLLKAKSRGGVNIPSRARERLKSEIDLIYKAHLGQHLRSPEREKQKQIIKVAAKEVIKARNLVDEELELMGSVKNPYGAVTDSELLLFERRQLATKRAILTNKLEKDGGDKTIISNNLAILAEMEPLISKIKHIETRLEEMEKGAVGERSQDERLKTNEETVIVRLGYGHNYRDYTYGDIMRMSLTDVKRLRKKVRDAKSKAKQRSKKNNGHVKSEKNRFKHEKEIAIKEKEVELINIIISHKEEKKI